jgi:hypothetical protein
MAVPDDPTAVAIFTAHRLDDTARYLAHASERLDAARGANGALRPYHLGHCARHLASARLSAHQLAENIEARYPAEGAELRAVTAAIGLARAVSPAAKTATTSHLVQTVCSHLGHTIRHVQAMQDDPDPDAWAFNHAHAATHLSGAAEHAAKLRAHFRDNYAAGEGRWLADLEPMTVQMAEAAATGLAERSAAIQLAVGQLLSDPRLAGDPDGDAGPGMGSAEVGLRLRTAMGLAGKPPTEYEASMPPVGDLARTIGLRS